MDQYRLRLQEALEADVSQAMRRLSVHPSFEVTLTKREVEYWIDNYSDTLFVCGKLRQVIFVPIMDTRYKVKTQTINR